MSVNWRPSVYAKPPSSIVTFINDALFKQVEINDVSTLYKLEADLFFEVLIKAANKINMGSNVEMIYNANWAGDLYKQQQQQQQQKQRKNGRNKQIIRIMPHIMLDEMHAMKMMIENMYAWAMQPNRFQDIRKKNTHLSDEKIALLIQISILERISKQLSM
jgi:hypothetical protein